MVQVEEALKSNLDANLQKGAQGRGNQRPVNIQSSNRCKRYRYWYIERDRNTTWTVHSYCKKLENEQSIDDEEEASEAVKQSMSS